MTEKEAKEIIKKIEEYLDNAEMSNDHFISIIGSKDIIENIVKRIGAEQMMVFCSYFAFCFMRVFEIL